MSGSPHSLVLNELVTPSWRRAVSDTPELRRIASIPRRSWTDAEAIELAAEMTKLLKTRQGEQTLRPFQALALHDLCAYGGVVGMGRVGVGKTLAAFLAPYVCEAHRPLLMIPANLREKTKRDAFGYRKHWEISTMMMAVESYETLARKNCAYYFFVTKPDLIICDEAHKLKNTKAAVTRRLKRYLKACADDTTGTFPKPKLMLLSGTFANRSIREYWHLLKWTLPRQFVPLPLELSELDMWSCALDEKVKAGSRIKVGALEMLCNEDERLLLSSEPLKACRRAYGRRLVETPGVVATTETFSGTKLTVTDVVLPLPKDLQTAFHLLRKKWQLPDGQPISDGNLAAQAAKQLALGFFYRWNPRPPKAWLAARSDWCSFVRKKLAHNKRDFDTEEQIRAAVEQGIYDREKLDAWERVRHSFVPNTEAVWLSDFAIDAAIDWASKKKGIIWVFHTAFGKRLEQKSGIRYYGEEGFSSDGSFIERHPAGHPLIASITANKEGKNLQKWNTNLVTHPPSHGGWWEQMIGRTHRDGQTEDVSVEMFASCLEHYQAFHKALGDAMFAQDSTPMVQKLLYADMDIPSLMDVEARMGESWHAGVLAE